MSEGEDVPTKRCTKCGEVKGVGEFGRHRSKRDGLQAHCKECCRESNARYRAENRDKERQRQSRWRAQHPETVREYSARYREENRDNERERSARYFAAHPEYRARWRAENPDKVRAGTQRRRARKASATVLPFTPSDMYAAWEHADAYTCWLCQLPITPDDPLEVEHVEPLSGGGQHALGNLAPSHKSCNARKGARAPYEVWREVMTECGYDVDALLSALS